MLLSGFRELLLETRRERYKEIVQFVLLCFNSRCSTKPFLAPTLFTFQVNSSIWVRIWVPWLIQFPGVTWDTSWKMGLHGTPLQYSCLENPIDGGAWWATSVRSHRVRHDWATSLSLFTFMHWRRKWQPTPVFLPGESQGPGSLVGYHLWGRTESDTTEVSSSSSNIWN